MPPFPFVRESLISLNEKADALVVSQTPVEALEREWKENGIDGYVRLIAGQEYGTKTEHLALAAKGKYPDDHILMIGDAPGRITSYNVCYTKLLRWRKMTMIIDNRHFCGMLVV